MNTPPSTWLATNGFPLAPRLALQRVNDALERNPQFEPKDNPWDRVVTALTPQGENDTTWLSTKARAEAERALDFVGEQIMQLSGHMSKLLKRAEHSNATGTGQARILAMFEPEFRAQVSRTVLGAQYSWHWLEKERRQKSFIGASSLTESERKEMPFRFAMERARTIVKDLMPWDEALERVHCKNYGVDRSKIISHFKTSARHRLEEIIDDHESNGERYRVNFLRAISSGEPSQFSDPVVEACDLFKDGREHLAECLQDHIYDGDLYDCKAKPGEYGLLISGEYAKESHAYWWIKKDRYMKIASELGNRYRDLLQLDVSSKRRRAGVSQKSACVSQGPMSRKNCRLVASKVSSSRNDCAADNIRQIAESKRCLANTRAHADNTHQRRRHKLSARQLRGMVGRDDGPVSSRLRSRSVSSSQDSQLDADPSITLHMPRRHSTRFSDADSNLKERAIIRAKAAAPQRLYDAGLATTRKSRRYMANRPTASQPQGISKKNHRTFLRSSKHAVGVSV